MMTRRRMEREEAVRRRKQPPPLEIVAGTNDDPTEEKKKKDPTKTTTTTTTKNDNHNNDDNNHNQHHYNNHQHPKARQRRKRRKKQTWQSNNDLSFAMIVVRVGTVLALVSWSTFGLYRHLFLPSLSSVDIHPITTTTNDDDTTTTYDDDGANLWDDHRSPTVDHPPPDMHVNPPPPPPQKEEEEKEPLLILSPHDLMVLEKDIDVPKIHHDPHFHSTKPPLPVWNLTDQAIWDAYGMYEYLVSFLSNTTTTTTFVDHHQKHSQHFFWAAANGVRRDFAQLYGGHNAARAILQRGLTTVSFPKTNSTTTLHNNNINNNNNNTTTIPLDVMTTACRIQDAQLQKRPFRMTFGGYSVTTGRGNYFSQSFPLVLEKRLHTLFHLLQVPLSVTNAAIGGCPSFPYGWCMSNFWGPNPDVVSWDFSMNEAGGDPSGLEAYLRHSLQLNHRPKVIVKDTYELGGPRRDLLQYYVDKNMLSDSIVLHSDAAAAPMLQLAEDARPEGFRDWRKFGSPPGAPGQALHHPAVKEHEFLAWLLTMDMLRALQVVAASMDQDYPFELDCQSFRATQSSTQSLPKPMADQVLSNTTTAKPWLSLLFGEPSNETLQDNHWRMNPVYCRTSFEPIQQGNLSQIIVSGSTGEDIDLLFPKSNFFYNRGWVYDLSTNEKKAKHKLDRFGGLGFIDSKASYYGLFTSGKLSILVPYQPSSSSQDYQPSVGDVASKWFKSVVLCEANEQRESHSVSSNVVCAADRDLDITIGGVVNVTTATLMDAPGTLYLGKKLCLYIPIDDDRARLTSRDILVQTIHNNSHTHHQLLLPNQEDVMDHNSTSTNIIGLAVEVKVNNRHIMRPESACSISHVVWEQHSIMTTTASSIE